jgi:hypothetical protein
MDDTLNGMDRIEDRNLYDAVMKAIELIMADYSARSAHRVRSSAQP